MKKNTKLSEEALAYFRGLGEAGGNKLREEKLKNDPEYYKRIAKEGWEKRRKLAGDKSI